MKRFFGVFFGAFAFFVLGDSSPLQGQNQPQNHQSRDDYLCESMREYDPWICFGTSDDKSPLGTRIPVILIHGWNPKDVAGEPNQDMWVPLTRHFYTNFWFNQRFKVYYLWYLSNVLAVRDIGQSFAYLIDQMEQVDPDFRGKQFVLVGHSMGGLVARSYMQETRSGSSGLNSERILRLITLGTPHRGTPLANGEARNAKAEIVGIGITRRLLELLDRNFFSITIRWDMENRSGLRWDNYDGLLDYRRFPTERNDWLVGLESAQGTLKRKIVAFGGAVSTRRDVLDCAVVPIPDISIDFSCSAWIVKHGLDAGDNDGVVPLKSALFEPCDGCLDTRVYLGYDHSEIASGKARFPWEGDEPLFGDIANYLLSLVMPRSAGFDNYADLGNQDDERFHFLSGWDRVNPGLLSRPDTDQTSRYQSLRGQNSVNLFVNQTWMPHRLTFRSETGYCDDSFAVYVNGRRLLTYNHDKKPDFPIHSVRVGAELVLNQRVNITFVNTARDNCGLAAIYYVRLDPLGF